MIKIRGHSDDIVSIQGDIYDEVDCYQKDVLFTIGNPEATPGQNAFGLYVTMRYGSQGNGVWSAEISPVDEDAPIPWTVVVYAEDYSAVVDINCPKGTAVKWKVRDRKGRKR
jgi:hypothetical protein